MAFGDNAQDYVTALGVLGGLLSLPRSSQYEQQEVERNRAMLQGTEMEPQAKTLFPDAPMGFMRAGPGIGGRILGGIGDVGSVLSAVAGKPIGPPRHDITDIANASKLRKSFQEQKALDTFASEQTGEMDATARMLIKTGNMDGFARYQAAKLRAAGGGPGGTSYLATRERLNRLRATNPNHPDIPILERTLGEYDVQHPAPTPPRSQAEELQLERERIGVRNEAERKQREDTVRRNPQWSQEQKDYHLATGGMFTPERPAKTPVRDFFRDIKSEVLKEHQQRAREILSDRGPNAPGAYVDPNAVQREAIERAEVEQRGGTEITNMPTPEQQPPAPQETGIGMTPAPAPGTPPPAAPASTTTTTTRPPPTTTSTTQPPQKSSALGNAKLPPKDQWTQAQHDKVAEISASKDPWHVKQAKTIAVFK